MPMPIIAGFPAPATYQQACDLEPSVCSAADANSGLPNPQAPLPAALQRPLKLPSLPLGERCPTTLGSEFDSQYFGGVAIGTGPVRPLTLVKMNAKGDVVLARSPDSSGWYSFKTLWFSVPSYQGPWLVRGAQLGGESRAVFGEQPSVSALVVPPIPTLNGGGGYRTAPGATYLRTPGCYGWQIDGLTFSYAIVFQVVLA